MKDSGKKGGNPWRGGSPFLVTVSCGPGGAWGTLATKQIRGERGSLALRKKEHFYGTWCAFTSPGSFPYCKKEVGPLAKRIIPSVSGNALCDRVARTFSSRAAF